MRARCASCSDAGECVRAARRGGAGPAVVWTGGARESFRGLSPWNGVADALVDLPGVDDQNLTGVTGHFITGISPIQVRAIIPNSTPARVKPTMAKTGR